MTYSKQDTFDAVASYLLRVRRKSRHHKTGQCLYRSGEDTARTAPYCAVGCLMPDAEVETVIAEGLNGIVLSMVNNYSPSIRQHDPHLLTDLQLVHDRYPPEIWEHTLERYATSNGLVFDLARLEELGRTQWAHVSEGPQFTHTPKLQAANVNLKPGTEAACG